MKLKNLKKLFFNNISLKQTILKNTFWLGLSETISKTLISIIVILIARYLGVEGFGKFSFAFAFVSFFAIIADLGLITLVIRDVARNVSLGKKYIDNILFIKCILAIFSFGAIFTVVNFLDKTQDIIEVVYLAGAWMIMQGFVQFFQSIFRAFEKMEYEALSRVIYATILFVTILFVMSLGLGLKFLMASYILATSTCFTVVLFLIRKKFTKFKFEIDLVFWKYLLREAWPFALFSVFAVIYFQISVVILSLLKTNTEVGIYSVAFNSVIIFLVLADITSSGLLPTLSKLKENREAFISLTKKMLAYLFILGISLAAFLFLAAPYLIELVYGKEFLGSVLAFKIIVWILPLRFMNYLFATSLIAADKQKSRLNAAMACAFLNIIINLMLIPMFSFLGAAVAVLLTEMFLFVIYFSFYDKTIGIVCPLENLDIETL